MKISNILVLMSLLAMLPSGAAHAQGRSAVASEPMRSVQMQYESVGVNDPNFRQLWPDEAKVINPRPADGSVPSAIVGHVREASGALLTITMLQAEEECGPNLCPIRILRNGKLVKEFTGCNEPTGHRVSADGKYLLVCDSQVAIPTN